MSVSVPVVDISPYVEGGDADACAEVARAMDAACRTVGFAQVLGHGVQSEVTAGLAAAMDALFGLPLEAKKAYCAPASVNRGYTAPRSESLSLSLGVESAARMNDFFEAFNVGQPASAFPDVTLPGDAYAENIWPQEVPGFAAAVGRYFAEASRVARTLTRVFADALGLAAGYFERFTDHSIDVMRMNNYALPPGTVDLDGDLTGMGEHTDYGIVTVLWADQVPGLQVLGHDGSWNDVSPVDGALLMNLGDLTARWTNERWLSTLHRVKPPVVDGTIERRRSAAFFHDGNIDAVVAALDTCLGPGQEPVYPPVTVGEHLTAKLAGSRGGTPNSGAVREAARALTASARRPAR